MAKTVQFLTEKGNVSVKVRNAIKEQANAMLLNRIEGLVVTEKGLALEVAHDISGKPIYMVINPTITMSTDVAERKPKPKATSEVEVPSLF